MTESFQEFDKSIIMPDQASVLKVLRLRIRELAMGGLAIICLLVIVVLAAIMASNKSSNPSSDSQTGIVLGADGHCNTTCVTPGCLRSAAHVTELLDEEISPCDDFHMYACGLFEDLHLLQPEQSEMTMTLLLQRENMEKIRRLLAQSPKDTKELDFEGKLHNFFASCMTHFFDTEIGGTPFLTRVVAPSGGWWALQDNSKWTAEPWNFQNALEKIHGDFWTDAFFTFKLIPKQKDWSSYVIHIGPSGIGYNSIHLDSNYFLNRKFTKVVEDYKTYIRNVGFLLLRDAKLNITQEEMTSRTERFEDDVILVEKQLANLTDHVSQSDTNGGQISLNALEAVSGGVVNWLGFVSYMLRGVHVTGETVVEVQEMKFVHELSSWIHNLVNRNETRILNNYMVWRLAQRYIRYLSWDYLKADEQLQRDMTDSEEDMNIWLHCVSKLSQGMKDALSALYIGDHFERESKDKAHEITDYVRNALLERLDAPDHWLSRSTRQAAMAKLRESLIEIGYPEYMASYSNMNEMYESLSVDKNDFFGNILSINAFQRLERSRRLSGHNPGTEWVPSTYDVVAKYYSLSNELIVTAGLLQFPFFEHSLPHYMNFGALGRTVAFAFLRSLDEFSSAFYRHSSNFSNSSSRDKTDSYQGVRSCLVDILKTVTQGPYYINDHEYVPVDAYKNAPLLLAESSSLQIALRAYRDWVKKNGVEKTLPGKQWTDEQLFFLSYAQTTCYRRRTVERFRLAMTGHIQEDIMVNSALAQVPEFQKAFNCPDESTMVAKTRCQLY